MKIDKSKWSNDSIPYICWDRNWTVADIRNRLNSEKGIKRFRLMAWLMRELKTQEVWIFLKPAEIYCDFDKISRWLGSRRTLWEHLFRMWHELGKI